MGRRWSRVASLIIATRGAVSVAGCPGMIRQAAVDAIAEQIRPPNPTLVGQLQTTANPKGEGIIVFARSESTCAPKYSWIWLNGNTPSYALDAASQALTPGLRLLSEASNSTRKRIGSEPATFNEVVESSLCQTAQR